jgi:hypothetical protein
VGFTYSHVDGVEAATTRQVVERVERVERAERPGVERVERVERAERSGRPGRAGRVGSDRSIPVHDATAGFEGRL